MSSNQGSSQIPGELVAIANAIAATQGYDREKAKQEEEKLKQAETSPQFGVKLLQILDQPKIPAEVKLGTAIYFKRFVERYWMLEENIISPKDRSLIQENLISVMVRTTRLAQNQLSETISTIAAHDFMTNWHKLKPDQSNEIHGKWGFLETLVSFLQPGKLSIGQVVSILGIIQSITSVHVGKDKTEEMVVQIRYIMEQFVKPVWLRFLEGWTRAAYSNWRKDLQKPPNFKNDQEKWHAYHSVCGLEKLVLIFHDLTSVDLIAYFEDSMNQWTKYFLYLLELDDKFKLLENKDDTPGPIDDLRTAVIKSAQLFASRYESESSDSLKPFLDKSIGLLSTLDDKERYDLLVAETTNYVQTIVKQTWHQALFDQNKLNSIVSGILIRNVKLRTADINRYEINGEEWVLRDMEGSDFCTRRRGALELLRKLCEVWKNETTAIIQQHMQRLLTSYNNNRSQNFIDLDTAINLFVATTVMGETRSEGAVKFSSGQASIQSITSFLQTYLMEYLTKPQSAPHPLIAADCLKYAIMFRSIYPQEMFEGLVQLCCNFLASNDFVTHTYAAIALDRLLSMKKKQADTNDDSKQNSNNNNNNNTNNGSPNKKGGGKVYKYPTKQLIQYLKLIILPLFKVLSSFEESHENEYVMKAIMRVIVRAEGGITDYIKIILDDIAKIIKRVSKNPTKPAFNHYMFEIIAACVYYSCKQNNQIITNFENYLLPLFGSILDNEQCNEFHPYVFQIVGLMLRIRGDITDKYVKIYDSMLKADRWQSDGNIIAISSMFADYYKIVSNNNDRMKTFMTIERFSGALGIYQYLLSTRTQDIFAFRILSALVEYCPLCMFEEANVNDNNKKFIRTTLEAVFSRLKAQKTNTLCANFIKCLSIYVLKHGFDSLFKECEEIQQGMFEMILKNVWLPYCRHVTTLGDRLIVTHAMIQIITHNKFLTNNLLYQLFLPTFCRIIEIFEVSPLEDKELNSMERRIQSLEDRGAGAKFSGLVFARAPNNYTLTKRIGDPRMMLVRSIQQITNQSQPFLKFLKEKLTNRYSGAFNEYSKQFGMQFNL